MASAQTKLAGCFDEVRAGQPQVGGRDGPVERLALLDEVAEPFVRHVVNCLEGDGGVHFDLAATQGQLNVFVGKRDVVEASAEVGQQVFGSLGFGFDLAQLRFSGHGLDVVQQSILVHVERPLAEAKGGHGELEFIFNLVASNEPVAAFQGDRGGFLGEEVLEEEVGVALKFGEVEQGVDVGFSLADFKPFAATVVRKSNVGHLHLEAMQEHGLAAHQFEQVFVGGLDGEFFGVSFVDLDVAKRQAAAGRVDTQVAVLDTEFLKFGPCEALNFLGGFVGDDLVGGKVADEGQNEQRRDNGQRLVHGV